MEHRLDGVKVRRILRQVAEACANSADRVLYTSNLMEGYVVSHHNVPTLERWCQTLLYVNQECFAVQPMGTSANSRSPRGFQPFRRTILVVIAVSSMNTRRVVSSQPCSRIQRRRARATSARFRSAARRLFFEGDAMASEKARKRAAASGDTLP